MTDVQEDHLSMIRTLLILRLLYALEIAALADVDADFDDLKAEADAIKLLLPQQKLQTTGVARDKHQQEIELVVEAIIIAGAVMSFASKAGNNTLFDEVKYSKSKLEHIRDTELADTCRIIHSRANANLLALAGRGITALMLTDFMTMITDYENMDQAPRLATVQTSTATVGMAARFANTQKILTERLDTGMRIFISVKPELYTAYRNARKLMNTGRRRRHNVPTGELDITVKDASNNVMEGVLVSSGAVLTSTDNTGLAKAKGLDPGVLSFRIFKQNYGEQFVNVTIVDGQVTTLTYTFNANRGSISGHVNFVTGSGPASIIVDGMATGVITDASGNFVLNDVPAGPQVIRAAKVSDPANFQTQNITVLAAGALTVNFSFP